MSPSDRLLTEEDVRVKFLVPYLEAHGYSTDTLEFEKAVEVQEGRKRKTIYADVVVYASSARNAPVILCETKAPTEPLNRAAKEQAISYARLLPRIAPIALLTNGAQVQVFQTLNKNRLQDLPNRLELQSDIVNFVVARDVQDALRAEAKHELFIIDDVQTFKSLLKACHNEIRNNEGFDPAQAFDEMSKLLFCKLHEEKEHSSNNRFRAQVFDETLQKLGVNVVQTIFRETTEDPRYAGLFETGSMIGLKDRTVRRIVSLFEDYDLSLTAFDVKGEAFEYFLSDTFTGGLGEYFTPRNIVEFMVDAIDPKIGEKVIDPFCGTGGFLIYAFDVVSDKIRLQEFSDEEKERWRLELSSRCLFGTDWKERTSQACKMNMMVHGDGSAGIFMHHGLEDIADHIEPNSFDICLTNPPFGAIENDPQILARYELGSGRQSQDRTILALERAIQLVKPGGWIAIVVIDGVLNNSSTAYVRDFIRRHVWVKAVVSLCKETFEGYGSRAKTSVLLLRRKAVPDDGRQEGTFMGIASNTGYAPNGAQIAGNQLPDILLSYKSFVTTGVPAAENEDSWVTTMSDRLDAEHYMKRTHRAPTSDLGSLQTATASLLSDVQVAYSELEQEIAAATREMPFKSVQLSEAVTEVRMREVIEPDRLYRLLGVRWWGEGVFVREEKLGKEVRASSVYRVSAGWIIYNRLFAFRGSFAIVTPAVDGCHVSGEFPTFALRPEAQGADLLATYIVYVLNSPQYLEMVDALSTGSTKTSRNRFNQKQFLQLRVQVPDSPHDLKALVSLLENAKQLRLRQEKLLAKFRELNQGLISILPQPDITNEN